LDEISVRGGKTYTHLTPGCSARFASMYAKVFSGEAEVNTPDTALINVGTFHVPYQPERIIPARTPKLH